MATSSRIDRGDRVDNRFAKDATFSDLEATVGTYQLCSYDGKQSRSDCYIAAKPLVPYK